tara:strand:- start:371 stop:1387 length:1017 start_codon:yes stop_codon:yes gene_type:complete
VRKLNDLQTPYLAVDLKIFQSNLEIMQSVRPGSSLRPHVKAFKSTDIAGLLKQGGYSSFCCATIKELEGLAANGLGDDLLLANETLNASRLRSLVDHGAQVIVAVDSTETIDAAKDGGIRNVLIDVNVGLPRCGCDLQEVEILSAYARRKGLHIQGVMGYEGHLMFTPDRSDRKEGVAKAMQVLQEAHSITGGEIISAGGTGTFDLNELATEIQAGSFLFMDTRYSTVGLPFQESLTIVSKIISLDRNQKRAVCDAGVKSFATDYGKPKLRDGVIEFTSDEHSTIVPTEPRSELAFKVGDLIHLRVPHVDPTIAKHPRLVCLEEGYIHGDWKVDLRGW